MEAKSQHFLLSPKARTLKLKRLYALSEDEAFDEFVALRFSHNDGKPFCEVCHTQRPYPITGRRKWKCSNKHCGTQFSATANTPFASRKLPFRDIMIAIALFAKAPKGLSAIRLSHELDVAYKTAFVMLHKIREQVGISQHRKRLSGKVEIDGGYNGGHVRPHNNKPSRVDRRRLEHKSGKRKCVVVMRERWGRSLAFVASEAEGAHIAPSVIEPESHVFADEDGVYNRLHGQFAAVSRVNHEMQYADGAASINWAESYFSRLDRSEMGIHHHIAGAYFDLYVDEMSWREDFRRRPDDEKFGLLAHLMTRGGVSRRMKGYWQRRKEAA